MSLSRTAALTAKVFLCVGAGVPLGLASVAAQGVTRQPTLVEAANRCADYGPGFADMGNGTCVRSSGHVRVGARSAAVDAWATEGTSNAGLRSDAPGMVRGAGDTGHLRIRDELESLSPFR